MTEPTPAEVARLVDHTLLTPEATPEQVRTLVEDALELGTCSVCVSPTMVPVARHFVDLFGADSGSPLKVATVAGFPSGAHMPSIKAAEAMLAAQQGADEVDMVISLTALRAGGREVTANEIHAVRETVPDAVLKVIIESAVLTDDEIVAACLAARDAGADFVKTSTGFHPAGGASVHAVALMRATVPDLGVKASGGIRTWDQALAMIDAGATRLGVSGTRALLG